MVACQAFQNPSTYPLSFMNFELVSTNAEDVILLSVALFATLCPHSLVNAQSGLSVYSAVNAASYDRMAIAEGSLFVIFGQGMGPSALTNPPTGSLPYAIAGTTVTAISGSLRLPCPLLYVSSGQVAAVLPSGTPVGSRP